MCTKERMLTSLAANNQMPVRHKARHFQSDVHQPHHAMPEDDRHCESVSLKWLENRACAMEA